MATSDSTIKRCSKCGFECLLSEARQYFSLDKRAKDGLHSWCSDCRHKYNADHREHIHRYNAERYYANREELREKKRNYSRQHTAERREYRLKNKEKIREYNKNWHEKNKLRTKERRRVWRKTPSGKASSSASFHKRRTQIQATGKSLTAADIQQILAAHTDRRGNLRCAKCGEIIEGNDYHLDHFIPLRHGGANTPGNFRVMHSTCNLKKSATHPHKLGMLI